MVAKVSSCSAFKERKKSHKKTIFFFFWLLNGGKSILLLVPMRCCLAKVNTGEPRGFEQSGGKQFVLWPERKEWMQLMCLNEA